MLTDGCVGFEERLRRFPGQRQPRPKWSKLTRPPRCIMIRDEDNIWCFRWLVSHPIPQLTPKTELGRTGVKHALRIRRKAMAWRDDDRRPFPKYRNDLLYAAGDSKQSTPRLSRLARDPYEKRYIKKKVI